MKRTNEVRMENCFAVEFFPGFSLKCFEKRIADDSVGLACDQNWLAQLIWWIFRRNIWMAFLFFLSYKYDSNLKCCDQNDIICKSAPVGFQTSDVLCTVVTCNNPQSCQNMINSSVSLPLPHSTRFSSNLCISSNKDFYTWDACQKWKMNQFTMRGSVFLRNFKNIEESL